MPTPTAPVTTPPVVVPPVVAPVAAVPAANLPAPKPRITTATLDEKVTRLGEQLTQQFAQAQTVLEDFGKIGENFDKLDKSLNTLPGAIEAGLSAIQTDVAGLPAQIQGSITTQFLALGELLKTSKESDKRRDRQGWIIGFVLAALIIGSGTVFYFSEPVKCYGPQSEKQEKTRGETPSDPSVVYVPNPSGPTPLNMSGFKIPELGINCPSSLTVLHDSAGEITLTFKK